jgi:DNA-binding transcriptional ArsR family regulator
MPEETWNLGAVQMEDIFIIDNLETLKVVADPLRLRILELLRRAPHTVKQLAAALNVPLKKLYYHVNLLEEHALIRVAGTRVVSGIIEKQYQISAYRLSVDRSLLSPIAPDDDDGLDAFLSMILDHVKSEIKKGVQAGLIDISQKTPGQRGLVLGRRWMRMSPERAAAFLERLKALEEEFEAPRLDSMNQDSQFYEFLLGLYPTEPPSARDTMTR